MRQGLSVRVGEVLLECGRSLREAESSVVLGGLILVLAVSTRTDGGRAPLPQAVPWPALNWSLPAKRPQKELSRGLNGSGPMF